MPLLIAIVASVVIRTILGILWYSPLLFAQPYIIDTHGSIKKFEEKHGNANHSIPYIVSFLYAFTQAFAFASLVQWFAIQSVLEACRVAIFLWVSCCAGPSMVHHFFDGRSTLRLFFIHYSYDLASFLASMSLCFLLQ